MATLNDVPFDVISKYVLVNLSCKDLANNKMVFKELADDIQATINSRNVLMYNHMLDEMTTKLVHHFTNLFMLLHIQMTTPIYYFSASFKIGVHQIYIVLQKHEMGLVPAGKLFFATYKDIENYNSVHWVNEENPSDILNYFFVENDCSKEIWVKTITPMIKNMLEKEIQQIPASDTIGQTVANLKEHVRRTYNATTEFGFNCPKGNTYSATYSMRDTGIYQFPNNWKSWMNIKNKKWKREYLLPIQEQFEDAMWQFKNCIIDAPFDFSNL